MARPTEPENNTIASIRVTCPDTGALQNILRVLEGALGKPVRTSKPYANVGDDASRVYVDWVVPCDPNNHNGENL